MKKLFSVLLLLGLMLFTLPGVTSAAGQADKPRVAVMYINNAKTTYDKEIDEKVLSNLVQAINPQKYVYVEGTPYLEKLKKMGIVDLTTAERADVVEVFEGEDIDYAVMLEINPFTRKEKVTFFTYGIDVTAVVPFRVIDLVNNKYLYNGRFDEKASDSTPFGSIGNKSVAMKALKKINEQVNAVLGSRLPTTRPLQQRSK